jgi:hypothetical protein
MPEKYLPVPACTPPGSVSVGADIEVVAGAPKVKRPGAGRAERLREAMTFGPKHSKSIRVG